MKELACTRSVKGQIYVLRFAYIHKRDLSRFGVIEAVDLGDARRHLGPSYHVQPVWVGEDDAAQLGFYRGTKWKIVFETFFDPTRPKYIGTKATEHLAPWNPPYDD